MAQLFLLVFALQDSPLLWLLAENIKKKKRKDKYKIQNK
jgi:hypothetical protein